MDRFTVVDPRGQDRETARRMGYAVVDLIVDHLAGLAERPVFSPHRLPAAPPLAGRPWPEVLDLLRRQVLPGAMQVAHPRFFGHMDSGPLYVSVLADLVAAALNQNLLHREISPLATEMEEAVVEWLCRSAGLPPAAGGTLVSGGFAANLTAICLARHRHPERRLLLASAEAHYSVAKIARLLGLTAESVPVDQGFRLDAAALARRLKTLPEPPLAVIATAGTTSTGSVDPLPEIALLCQRSGTWLHVDAAHGGAALLCADARLRLTGIEQADSITIDPHKWLLQPKSMGVILVQEPERLAAAFATGAPYLSRGGPTSLGQLTLQGTRRWDALRLWLAWQHLGDAGLAAVVEHGLALTQYLAETVAHHPEFEAAHQPDLNLLCFRLKGADERTEAARERLVRSGAGYLSLTTLQGRRWLRAVMLNPSTTTADVDAVLAALLA